MHWLKNETGQTVILFGISLGATIALQAAEHHRDIVKAIVAISPDMHTASSDASISSFLTTQITDAKNRRLKAKLMKLGAPPYIDSATFQLRASLLADLGAIEHGKRFGRLMRETLLGLLGTYGLLGTVRALRNMNQIQRKLLPQLVTLNLLAKPPRLEIPVHFVFGEQDPLIPAELVKQLPLVIITPENTVSNVSQAGHMVHFDQPDVVRSIVIQAGKPS